jgi:hypothetical protein
MRAQTLTPLDDRDPPPVARPPACSALPSEPVLPAAVPPSPALRLAYLFRHGPGRGHPLYQALAVYRGVSE